jgi:Protein of unknown function (DUF3237)
MQLEPLYRAAFTTPEAWSVELEGEHGTEGRSFLLAEGRSEGRGEREGAAELLPPFPSQPLRLRRCWDSARLRGANFPRRRVDGTLTPDFRGVLETDDGATVLYAWHGYGRAGRNGERELVGSVTHETGDPRYSWLNTAVCALAGEVRPREDGAGFDVVYEVAEIVWEHPGAVPYRGDHGPVGRRE